MRVHFTMLVGALLLAGPALAQTTPVSATDQAAIVAPVQKAVVRALNFGQGDVERLRGAREDFTPSATILGQGDGALHVVIRGTLKHGQNASSTTYPIVIEVRAGGTPLKIEHLEQTVCIGAKTMPCQ
jgi:hypothetical protein